MPNLRSHIFTPLFIAICMSLLLLGLSHLLIDQGIINGWGGFILVFPFLALQYFLYPAIICEAILIVLSFWLSKERIFALSAIAFLFSTGVVYFQISSGIKKSHKPAVSSDSPKYHSKTILHIPEDFEKEYLLVVYDSLNGIEVDYSKYEYKDVTIAFSDHGVVRSETDLREMFYDRYKKIIITGSSRNTTKKHFAVWNKKYQTQAYTVILLKNTYQVDTLFVRDSIYELLRGTY